MNLTVYGGGVFSFPHSDIGFIVTPSFPPEIKIGAFTYRIVREHEVPNLGLTRHADMEISVSENIALPLATLILWREIFSAIKTYWTDAASINGLLTVFRDNPEVLSWTNYVLQHGHSNTD